MAMSGEQFAAARELLGYTKEGFCKKMGIGVSTLMKYEAASEVPIMYEQTMRNLGLEKALQLEAKANKWRKFAEGASNVKSPIGSDDLRNFEKEGIVFGFDLDDF